MRIIACFLAALLATLANASGVVNVFVWSSAIPDKVITQFEKETGIRVNFNIYESTEALLAKLKASQHSLYDVIEPSSYYIKRMQRAGMLEKLDKTRLPNIKHLDPYLMSRPHDPDDAYSLPYIWGVTGIVINTQYHSPEEVDRWEKLWDPAFYNQLAVIDDPREVFSVALTTLGYDINENDPKKIHAAFLHLKKLLPNIKLFSSDVWPSILADEDVTIGIAWNGDAVKARRENPHIEFVLPKEGALIWVDCLAIPSNAPNKDNAYTFINFLLRPDIAKEVALEEGYSLANLSARRLLPEDLQHDPIAYPSAEKLEKSFFQSDADDHMLALYSRYWTLLKLAS